MKKMVSHQKKNKKKNKSKRYPEITITEVDYTDNLTFLANTSAQAKYLLFTLEPSARIIGLYLIDKFIYIRSNISSTESDVNLRIRKAWAAVNILLADVNPISDEIKYDFFQTIAVSVLLCSCTT